MSDVEPLTHPLLARLGVEHGFGVRGWVEPADLRRPKQVHGRAVVDAARLAVPVEADAVVSDQAGVGAAIITADCVPILLADRDAQVVAAVHAGWKGLAGGVIGASVSALTALGADTNRLTAVVGPCVGSCCYEVDEPVLSAFGERFAALMKSATQPTRPGHARLDLGAIAIDELTGCGLSIERVGSFEGVCTSCDRHRFHSFRRDGSAAGRMVHYIRTPDGRGMVLSEG